MLVVLDDRVWDLGILEVLLLLYLEGGGAIDSLSEFLRKKQTRLESVKGDGENAVIGWKEKEKKRGGIVPARTALGSSHRLGLRFQ